MEKIEDILDIEGGGNMEDYYNCMISLCGQADREKNAGYVTTERF